MNILYIHRTQAKGVEGVHIRGVVEALRELGHRVEIFSPMGDSLEAAEESGQAQPVSRWKARIYWIISRVTPEIVFEILEIGYSLYGFRQARRKFRSSEIDAIFERYAIFGMIGARLAARWNKPLVLEIRRIPCAFA